MRKLILFVLGLLVMAITVAAQTHDNGKERAVRDNVVLDSALRVGNVVLPAGEYRISCDREIVTFVRMSDHKTMVEAKCKGRDLGRKADDTAMSTKVDAAGVRSLETLQLHGSTIEHTFN